MHGKNIASRLLVRINKADKPPLRLIYFPYEGGDALVFNEWVKYLPLDVEIFSVRLPGRSVRLSEDLIDNMLLLIDSRILN